MTKDRVVVILFGPPGSGKGTQANLLVEKTGLVHFDSGRYLEKTIYAPGKKTKELLAARKQFEAGDLIDPVWVTKIFMKRMTDFRKLGFGFVSSGSPRTMYEAERTVPLLTKLYGKKDIFVFVLKVPDAVSIKRNSDRLMCSECHVPLLKDYYNGKPIYCPQCGGKLYKRTLDKPEIIKNRLVRYKKETEPIFDFMKKNGFKVKEVDGKPAPYKVFRTIYDHLKNS